MKIFVTGASGFIGFEVCIGLRRAGHHVFGLVRSADKAKILEQNEIVAVVGDLHHPESYINVAEKCQVLIHTAADYSQFQLIHYFYFQKNQDQNQKWLFTPLEY